MNKLDRAYKSYIKSSEKANKATDNIVLIIDRVLWKLKNCPEL